MTTHLVAYVQKKLITSWKRNTLKHSVAGRPTFLYSSNDDWQFGPHARSNAVLWIIGTQSPEPPALVARLDNIARVGEEIDESELPATLLRKFNQRKYVVRGDEESRFFAHNDVSGTLLDTTFLDKADERFTLQDDSSDTAWHGRRYGNRLMRPCRIADGSDGARPLQMFADKLCRKTVFISYKRRDHAAWSKHGPIRQFIRDLVTHDYAVWLDKLALPRTRPRKGDTRSWTKEEQDRMLTLLLDYGLERSRILIAVSSLDYGKPSRSKTKRSHAPAEATNWTLGEWNGFPPAQRTVWALGEPPSNCLDLSVAETFSHAKEPGVAAQDFRDWFERADGPLHGRDGSG